MKVTFFRHISSLRYVIIFVVICIGFIFYKYRTIGYFDPKLLWITLPFLLFIIPTLILHVQYFIEERKKVVEFDNIREVVTIKKGKSTIVLDYKYIKSITKVSRNISDDGGLHWFPWANYFYYRIVYQDDTVYLITSLIADSLNFGNINYSHESDMIPFLSKKGFTIINIADEDAKRNNRL